MTIRAAQVPPVATERREGLVRAAGPGWVPGASQSPVDRETMWYDFALGDSRPRPARWVLHGHVGDPEAPNLPPADQLARPGAISSFPVGLWNALRSSRFPETGSIGGTTSTAALLAVSAVRRDPSDPYNDHRGYASPRCLFPVHALVADGDDPEWQLVDPDRRRLIRTGVTAEHEAIALTGQYARIPFSYGWFAGSLVCLETGILTRHLAALGTTLGLRLQVSTGGDSMSGPSPWSDPQGWSPPLILRPGAPAESPTPTPAPAVRPPDSVGHRHLSDPEADVRAVYGAHRVPDDPACDLPSGIPDDAASATADGSWAQTVWSRSAGRMPNGLWGFRLAPRPLEHTAVTEMAKWAAAAPPACWRATRQHMEVRLLARSTAGLAAGVYHLRDDGSLSPDVLPPQAIDQATAAYLYPANERAANDLDRAPAVWLITARPRPIVQGLGPVGWTRLHQTAGWITHGLGLAAAAQGIVARPVRAFDERLLAAALHLRPDEMPCIAVIAGHHQPHGGLQIDLRS